MTRTGVLVGDRDKKLGTVRLPDTVFVVRHGEDTFVRTAEGVRLAGGGIGVVFRVTEVYVRERLEPI